MQKSIIWCIKSFLMSTCAIPFDDIAAWLQNILPKCILSGATSACLGRLAPHLSQLGIKKQLMQRPRTSSLSLHTDALIISPCFSCGF